jgi:hypothetical protein
MFTGNKYKQFCVHKPYSVVKLGLALQNKFDSIHSVVLATILFFNYRKTQQSLQ